MIVYYIFIETVNFYSNYFYSEQMNTSEINKRSIRLPSKLTFFFVRNIFYSILINFFLSSESNIIHDRARQRGRVWRPVVNDRRAAINNRIGLTHALPSRHASFYSLTPPRPSCQAPRAFRGPGCIISGRLPAVDVPPAVSARSPSRKQRRRI